MIGYFPDPYPDETMYSLCARYGERMQYSIKRAIGQELFGQEIISITDLPVRLGSLVKALPPGHTCREVDRLIDRHTLLPLYRPFLLPERLHELRQKMRTDERMARTHSGIVCQPPRPEWFQFCPHCVFEDRARYGECYWHRVHQINGGKS